MFKRKNFFTQLLYTLFMLYPWLVVPEASAANNCIILQYHHFSTDTPRSTSVTPDEFEAHLNYLTENRYYVWPLDHVVDHLKSNRQLPEKCVAITVDDAYVSVYKEAFPRLRKRGWTFTVFVSSEGVDRGRGVYMTWEQMREMAGSGVRFENHSHSHSHLIRRRNGESRSIWLARVEKDISKAQRRIFNELGQEPRLFAYPYGEYNTEIKAIVDRLGLTGFGQQSGPAWTGSDFLALPRFSMAASFAAMPEFKIKVRTLPLPVIEATPGDPVLSVDEWQPVLTLRLAEGDYRKEQLRCYVSEQGAGDVTWEDKSAGILKVRAKAPLNVGRSRYNCTTPNYQGNRFYWYSHTWIRRNKDGSWYRE